MKAGESRSSFEMSCYFPWGFFFLVLCLLQSMLYMSCGCSVDERAALMDIRFSLMRANSTVPRSWGRSEDCCSWEHVKCNNSTRRVSHLYLSNLYEHSYNVSGEAGWLNSTVLSAFHELQFLDLSENCPKLNGALSFNGLAGLTKLQYLNLSGNCLGVLYLKSNPTSEALPDAAFQNLQNLRKLDLSYNDFNGSLPMSLFALPHLKTLNLSGNIFGGRIPISSSSELVSLEVLDLSYNIMSGALPTDQAFENLRNLRELHLSYNQFSGNLPTLLFSLPHMKVLDLSRNLLEGPVPISSSSNLSSSLKSLKFSQNNLSGRISFFWLRNLMKLEEIDLSENTNLVVDVNVPGWVPLFQLKRLALSGCDLDKGIIAEPHFLRTQHHLQVLDLSNNNLSGSMPNWLFTKEATLLTLNLGNNSLTGSLDPIWHPQTYLQDIRISINRISGQLPSNIGSVFPSLSILDFSNNNISGDIPRSLCHINSIKNLDLSNNKFSGELPACVFSDFPDLVALKVSNNQLGGLILGGMNNLSSEMAEMDLNSNKFEGTLPRNLSSGNLLHMDLHDNKLSGNLDTSFWNLPYLELLNLADNHVTGEIHPKICQLERITVLDLSNNILEGSIPNCSRTTLMFLNVSGNYLYSDIPNAFLTNSGVEFLDLRDNQFTGNLDWIQYLDEITLLSLGGNKFEGQISRKMCRLQSLRIMDLSHNSLSGPLPPCIGDIPFNNVDLWWLANNNVALDRFLYDEYYYPEGFSFRTKGKLYTYGRGFFESMSGIDLSGNSLSGEIPWELGNLNQIKSLNLSNNSFTGPIPESFSRMSAIESMDLSHNELSGQIPWQLTQLSSLEMFSVAYNNLSGCVPNTGQFGSFDMDSYKGNNNLQKASQGGRCTSRSRPVSLSPEDAETKEDDPVLYVVSAASFVLTFWATVAFVFCHSFGQRVMLKL